MRPLSLCIYQVPEATHSVVWQHLFGCMEVCSRNSVGSGHRRTTKGNMMVGCPQGDCCNSWWSLEQGCPERPQWCHQPDITHQMTFTKHLWGAKAKLSTGFLQDTAFYPLSTSNSWLKFISSFRSHSWRARCLEAVPGWGDGQNPCLEWAFFVTGENWQEPCCREAGG